MLVAVHIHIGLFLSLLFFFCCFCCCVHFFFLQLHRWDNVRLGLLSLAIVISVECSDRGPGGFPAYSKAIFHQLAQAVCCRKFQTRLLGATQHLLAFRRFRFSCLRTHQHTQVSVLNSTVLCNSQHGCYRAIAPPKKEGRKYSCIACR